MKKNYVILTMFAEGGVTKKVQGRAPKLDQLQTAVKGPIETIPYFTWIDTPIGGYTCGVAYCNENSKLYSPRPPLNHYATTAWWRSAGAELPDMILGDAVFIARTDEAVDDNDFTTGKVLYGKDRG
jgi:hypothetical protein